MPPRRAIHPPVLADHQLDGAARQVPQGAALFVENSMSVRLLRGRSADHITVVCRFRGIPLDEPRETGAAPADGSLRSVACSARR